MGRKLKTPLPPVATANIGKQLAAIRKSRGLTQVQLAGIIGIKQYLISDYENGKVALSADMLARFCLALRCSADDVFNLPKEKVKLRLVKRLNAIDALPENTKKYILRTIDTALKATRQA